MKQKTTILFLTLFSISLYAQANEKKVNESKNSKAKPARMFTFTSMGDEVYDSEKKSYKNYKLIRTLRYVAQEKKAVKCTNTT